MNPYYEDESVTLFHGDCREVTAWLDADVLLFDPPYGRSWRSGSGMTNSSGYGRGSKPHGGIANDGNTQVRDEVLEAWGGKLALTFGDPNIDGPFGRVGAWIYRKAPDAGVKGARAGVRRDIEMIWLTGPWPVTTGGRSAMFTSRQWVAGPTGAAFRFGHPHAKPTDLLEDLMSLCPSGTIADPTAGSGSTLVVAKAVGRRAVGVELDERHCETAAHRLSQSVLDFGEASA